MSRLLEATNARIEASLTLDVAGSPLSRLRGELLQVFEGVARSNTQFHAEVRATLEAFKARREEAARSTRHGGEFEEAGSSKLWERSLLRRGRSRSSIRTSSIARRSTTLSSATPCR